MFSLFIHIFIIIKQEGNILTHTPIIVKTLYIVMTPTYFLYIILTSQRLFQAIEESNIQILRDFADLPDIRQRTVRTHIYIML